MEEVGFVCLNFSQAVCSIINRKKKNDGHNLLNKERENKEKESKKTIDKVTYQNVLDHPRSDEGKNGLQKPLTKEDFIGKSSNSPM